MTALGPIVVVTESAAAELVAGLGKAGAFPIIETDFSSAPKAIAEIDPSALVMAGPVPPTGDRSVPPLVRKLQARRGPIMPVLMNPQDAATTVIPFAIPIALTEPADRIVARLRSALRVRALHTAVLRRTPDGPEAASCVMPPDLLDHATVLCMGRGRSYPDLTTAIGEQVSLIGALSVETAARYLKSRDIDGVVIGDGFGPKVADALLTVLAEDPRFRDIPVGLFGSSTVSESRLPNLFHVEKDPAHLLQWLLPLVRAQAFAGHLNRTLKSLDSGGKVDSQTGLVACDAFWHELDRAVHDAEDAGGALSIARFCFDDIDPRGCLDLARLFSRLVRNVDFACLERDGAILAAFTDTDLRSAHVVARRLAGALLQTMVASDRNGQTIKPTVTLATLKPTDNLSTLVARVGTYPTVAAG